MQVGDRDGFDGFRLTGERPRKRLLKSGIALHTEGSVIIVNIAPACRIVATANGGSVELVAVFGLYIYEHFILMTDLESIRRINPFVIGYITPADAVYNIGAIAICGVDGIAGAGDGTVVIRIFINDRFSHSININLLDDIVVKLAKVIANTNQLFGIGFGIT